jgi:pSer/pThr/pTyr-binding forkhead associated (FHA) protein
MLQIELQYQGSTLATYETEAGEVTIGRNPGNDIHIDNLAVSGHHAVIRKVMNAHFIEDLQSTNGTFVNEKKIAKYELLDGDQVIIGKHCLLFRFKQGARAQNILDETMVLDTRKQQELLDKNRC